MARRPETPLLAIVCSALAILAVMSITGDSITKESVPQGTITTDLEVAKATAEPETEFMELAYSRLGSPIRRAGKDLKLEEKLAVIKAGEKARAPQGFTDPVIKSPASETHNIYGAPHKYTQYERNCLTLKAYAMNVADQVADHSSKALNILKPILLAVAEQGDCVKQLNSEFATLRSNKNIMLKSSIAKSMTDSIEHEMKSGKGILLWRTLQYHNAGCNLDPVECLKISQTKMTGAQFAYVDANRVGWSGAPDIFHQLSVRTTALLDTANKLKIGQENLVKNGLASDHKKPPFLTKAQGEMLKNWGGNF